MATVFPYLSVNNLLCYQYLGISILYSANFIAVVLSLFILYNGSYNHYYGTDILCLINNIATVSSFLLLYLGS